MCIRDRELTVSAAADACRSLKQVQEEQGLTAEQAPGAISAALSADDEVFVALLDQTVGGLWKDASAIEALIGLAPRIKDAAFRETIFTSAGHLLIEEPESEEASEEDSGRETPRRHAGLLDAMLTLESDLAVEALENDRVTQGIKTQLRSPYLSEEEQAEIATTLLEAALGRDHQSALLDCVLTLILDSESPTGRAEAIARIPEVVTGLAEIANNRLTSMIESAETFDEAAGLIGHLAGSEALAEEAASEEDETS